MSPAERAVDPLGTASRSITTASTPASFAASAPQIPAAPAPMISSGTRVSHFPSESKLTALMTHQGGACLLTCAIDPVIREIQAGVELDLRGRAGVIRNQHVKADVQLISGQASAAVP